MNCFFEDSKTKDKSVHIPIHDASGKVNYELLVANSDIRVRSSNLRVTSSNLQATSSNPRVASLNL